VDGKKIKKIKKNLQQEIIPLLEFFIHPDLFI